MDRTPVNAYIDQVCDEELQNLVQMNARCPGCQKRFIGSTKEDVVLDYNDNYSHRACVEIPRD